MSLVPRTVLIIILLCICTASTGCRTLWNFKQPYPLPPALPENEIDLTNLMAAINQNTNNIRQLESDVKISLNGLPTAISGTLLMEAPNRLRMQAGFLGMTDLGVDIGSNDEVFWIWTKTAIAGQPSTIMYARHDQFMQSAAGKQMRLQPKWIVNAMGLISFEASDKHAGPFIDPVDKRLKIQSEIVSDGEPMTRIVKINPKYGWIEQVTLYDADGTRVAYANAMDHRYTEEHEATLPHFVQLYLFPEGGEKMELTIQVKRSKLNELYVNPESTWGMPQPNDIPQIDMSQLTYSAPHSPPDSQLSRGHRSNLQPNGILARERGYTVTR